MDTPRRARTSVTRAGDNRVGLRHQLVHQGFRQALRRTALALLDHRFHAMLFDQQLRQVFNQQIEIRLGVVDEADGLADEVIE